MLLLVNVHSRIRPNKMIVEQNLLVIGRDILDLNRMDIYVVVQFYPQFKFYFLLFSGIVMYENEFGTKGK